VHEDITLVFFSLVDCEFLGDNVPACNNWLATKGNWKNTSYEIEDGAPGLISATDTVDLEITKWMRCCAGECMAVLKSAEKFTLPVLQAGVPISL
jgi:hypothetical protein